MKKILFAFALSAAMLTGAASMASAATYTDMSTVDITKVYTLTNAGTTSPAETFMIEQVGDVVITKSEATLADITGSLSISNAQFAAGAAGDATSGTGTFTVTLPAFSKVGVYTYTLQETAGTTAGVTYRTETIKLVVTVIEQDGKVRVAAVHCEDAGDDKTSSFAENEYSAGSLAVTKTVTGNLGDKDKSFDVTVTFTAPTGRTVNSTISYTVGMQTCTISPDVWKNGKAEVRISLSDGDTITFTNIPYGVTYTVVEDDYTGSGEGNGYDAASYDFSDASKTIDSASDSVEIINNKSGEVDTGISLDSMPYVLILGLVILGAVYLLIRRRRSDRF